MAANPNRTARVQLKQLRDVLARRDLELLSTRAAAAQLVNALAAGAPTDGAIEQLRTILVHRTGAPTQEAIDSEVVSTALNLAADWEHRTRTLAAALRTLHASSDRATQRTIADALKGARLSL